MRRAGVSAFSGTGGFWVAGACARAAAANKAASVSPSPQRDRFASGRIRLQTLTAGADCPRCCFRVSPSLPNPEMVTPFIFARDGSIQVRDR
jgi:hypothetical protein